MVYGWCFVKKVGVDFNMIWLFMIRKYILEDGKYFDISYILDVFDLNIDEFFKDLNIINGDIDVDINYFYVKEVFKIDLLKGRNIEFFELYRYGYKFIVDDLVGYRFNNEFRYNIY